MRVLAIRRQSLGAIATLTDSLPPALEQHGVEFVVDDAEAWIPDKTGPKVDKEVTRQMRAALRGFDLVHAFAYRPAWACAEAFYVRQPWLYTAYDLPRTTHPDLVDRLNAARVGLCSSRAVRDALDAADTLHLQVVAPGVRGPSTPVTREEARQRLGLPLDVPVVGAVGRFIPDRGFDSLVRAMPLVWRERPEVQLVLSGEGPSPPKAEDPRIRLCPPFPDVYAALPAFDLLVVPSVRAGFSLVAVEAMSCAVPVLARNISGLAAVGMPGASLLVFADDDSLPPSICEALGSPERSASVGNAGRALAQDTYSLERHARALARVYREVLGP
ncbi:MAG: glycosyltransferase family 4 protein [Fimbriimonadaceae bacterium]|nr:glycosyltransferase family 4 protein [Fimbriimonadaceae bacterium]QYK55716.1 MAG: glycosyltransferase family 4 protein [Fimbriimonadaceae bacterium]